MRTSPLPARPSWLCRPPLVVNPAYADLLRRAGLLAAEDFLALPETIVSGHPNRQVSRVTLGTGPGAVTAFLKKEHRVPWKERLTNSLAGFGFASKSWREARTLAALRPAFPGCPDWIAAGESGGRAFLLVRDVPGAVELRRHLESAGAPPARRRLARHLGEALARLHAAGFAHGDLYANHVLVAPESGRVTLVDWQRSGRRGRPGWGRRWRDLAALSATLPDDLVGPRDRLACLRGYVRSSVPGRAARRALLRRAAGRVAAAEARLLRRRHVRAKRLPLLPPGQQSLVCLEADNALCVTPAFLALWPSEVPEWLLSAPKWRKSSEVVPLPDGGCGRLVKGRYRLAWLRRAGWVRSVWTSPERRQMNALNRLQRCGIEAPQVLAVGERGEGDGWVHAFLLTRVASPC